MDYYREFKKIKNILKLNKYVKKSSNYCTYGYENLFWLEIVLSLLGHLSLREKVGFLVFLEDKGKLANFYKNIGIKYRRTSKNKIPSIATFSQYKRSFICKEMDYTHLVKSLSKSIKSNDYYHISIDGKDIRNSGKCLKGRDNVKSIHCVYDKMLIYSDYTQNENQWIKNNFSNVIQYFKSHPFNKGKDIIFTSDCIYNNKHIRQKMNEYGCYYLFPFKSQYKQFGQYFHQKKLIKEKYIIKYNKNKIFNYRYQLFKLSKNEENINFLIYIEKEIHDIKTQETNNIIQQYISNHTNENIDYFNIKMNHWDVESFHKIKYVWLNEDRYHKSQKNAPYIAVINNFIAFIYNKLGIKVKNKLKVFQLKLYEALVCLSKFIYQTLLNSNLFLICYYIDLCQLFKSYIRI